MDLNLVGATMKPIRILLAVLALIGLSACYTSDKPLVTDADSVTPFQKITFYNQEDNKPLAFAVDGKQYVSHGPDGDAFLRLKATEGDYYVAQLTGGSGDTLQILFGYMRIDPSHTSADLWKIIGTKDDARPGLRECKDGICVDDLNAYIAYAKEAIAGGAKADMSMKIVVE
jgi:hypothetical protein